MAEFHQLQSLLEWKWCTFRSWSWYSKLFIMSSETTCLVHVLTSWSLWCNHIQLFSFMIIHEKMINTFAGGLLSGGFYRGVFSGVFCMRELCLETRNIHNTCMMFYVIISNYFRLQRPMHKHDVSIYSKCVDCLFIQLSNIH